MKFSPKCKETCRGGRKKGRTEEGDISRGMRKLNTERSTHRTARKRAVGRKWKGKTIVKKVFITIMAALVALTILFSFVVATQQRRS